MVSSKPCSYLEAQLRRICFQLRLLAESISLQCRTEGPSYLLAIHTGHRDSLPYTYLLSQQEQYLEQVCWQTVSYNVIRSETSCHFGDIQFVRSKLQVLPTHSRVGDYTKVWTIKSRLNTFICILQILLYFYYHLVHNILKKFYSWLLLWPMFYLEVCLLSFQIPRDFSTLKFIKTCFIT